MLENKMDKDNRSTFKIECNTDIFTDVEIKLLLKHGVWLRSLMHKDIQPQTDKQRHFLHVFFTWFSSLICNYINSIFSFWPIVLTAEPKTFIYIVILES